MYAFFLVSLDQIGFFGGVFANTVCTGLMVELEN